MTTEAGSWGVVVIGRNEGERLKRCIASVQSCAVAVVYVDSGSTDGSQSWADSQGVEVIDLDMSHPFTAARARNEGTARLLTLLPDIEFVQFVDGDCEVMIGWLETAARFLAQHPQVAVVCGRRRERFPEASIFNAQCDREWNTPVGEAKACGGDAMFRRSALEQAGGYRGSLIAGEEPELCLRLRAAGWRIWRLDHEMTLHDAAILHWRQWWRRAERTGHAFAEGAWLHGASPERHWVKETLRALLWGMILPAVTISLMTFNSPVWWILLLAYPLQAWRISRRSNLRGVESFQQAFLLLAGKVPESVGAMKFFLKTVLKKQSRIIEYK